MICKRCIAIKSDLILQKMTAKIVYSQSHFYCLKVCLFARQYNFCFAIYRFKNETKTIGVFILISRFLVDKNLKIKTNKQENLFSSIK